MLQGITHGSKGEIIDLYNSPLWKLKCEDRDVQRVPAPSVRALFGDANDHFSDGAA